MPRPANSVHLAKAAENVCPQPVSNEKKATGVFTRFDI